MNTRNIFTKLSIAVGLVALVAAFGQLHGTLIKQQRLYNAARDIAPPAAPLSGD